MRVVYNTLFCGYSNGFFCVSGFSNVLRIHMHMCLTVD